MILGSVASQIGGPRVPSFSYTQGTPLQGGLRITDNFITPFALPSPSDFAYYPFISNFAEYQGNFPTLSPESDTNHFPTILGGGGVRLEGSSKQFIKVTVDEFSYDLLGFVGGSGDRYWLMGCFGEITELPSQNNFYPIFSIGLEIGRRILVYINSQGDVELSWEGSTTKEVKLAGVVRPNTPFGFWAEHSSGVVTLSSHTGDSVQVSAPPYFSPSQGIESNAILIGKALMGGSVVENPNYVNEVNTHPTLDILNPLSIQNTTNTYVASHPGAAIQPNTGRYYVEIENNNTFDLHLGVLPTGQSLSSSIGVSGWAINTINGRKFAQQTGGGTNWGSATPSNSVIGMIYDSDTGDLEYFVNGISRGKPFPTGTITVPVTLGISPIGDVNTGTNAVVSIRRSSFSYPQVGTQNFPLATQIVEPEQFYYNGRLRNVFLRNAPFDSPVVQQDMIDPDFKISLMWANESSTLDASSYIVKIEEGSLITYTPDLPAGAYSVYLEKPSRKTNPVRFNVKDFSSRNTALDLDFSQATLSQVRQELYIAHKQWGGVNGGVIQENIWLDPGEGHLVVRALGDNYTGPLRGVDRVGNRTDFSTRMGGCVATKDYFGPGSYEVEAKLPIEDGVVTAYWTFHYEEGYPGTPVFESHLEDGLRVAGNLESGLYTVRNHEIDIEIPSALKGSPDMEVVSYSIGRFNTWRGENRNWDVDENHPDYWTEYTDMFTDFGFPVNDGEFHKFRFDWHLHPTPKVEFYIDDIKVEEVFDTVPDIPGRFWVGLWFPSAVGNRWAGKTANFEEEFMLVKSIKITPFTEQMQNVRNIGETYPNDGWRQFPVT